jgi:hypothetical protein
VGSKCSNRFRSILIISIVVSSTLCTWNPTASAAVVFIPDYTANYGKHGKRCYCKVRGLQVQQLTKSIQLLTAVCPFLHLGPTTRRSTEKWYHGAVRYSRSCRAVHATLYCPISCACGVVSHSHFFSARNLMYRWFASYASVLRVALLS